MMLETTKITVNSFVNIMIPDAINKKISYDIIFSNLDAVVPKFGWEHVELDQLEVIYCSDHDGFEVIYRWWDMSQTNVWSLTRTLYKTLENIEARKLQELQFKRKLEALVSDND